MYSRLVRLGSPNLLFLGDDRLCPGEGSCSATPEIGDDNLDVAVLIHQDGFDFGGAGVGLNLGHLEAFELHKNVNYLSKLTKANKRF